jgi:hypothetical protein
MLLLPLWAFMDCSWGKLYLYFHISCNRHVIFYRVCARYSAPVKCTTQRCHVPNYSLHQMGVGGQLHTPVAVPSGGEGGVKPQCPPNTWPVGPHVSLDGLKKFPRISVTCTNVTLFWAKCDSTRAPPMQVSLWIPETELVTISHNAADTRRRDRWISTTGTIGTGPRL